MQKECWNMKRKYYLRGLGFGILITALVFVFANTSELSDEEIIKRAGELGYVKAEEQTTPSIGLKDLLDTETPVPTKKPEATPTEIPEVSITPEAMPTELPTPTEALEPTTPPTPTATAIPTPTEVPEVSVLTVTIVIEPGNTAMAVCDKIEAAGILQDGTKLRDYLVAHNLADYINVGSYTLSDTMSLEDIAHIITGR